MSQEAYTCIGLCEADVVMSSWEGCIFEQGELLGGGMGEEAKGGVSTQPAWFQSGGNLHHVTKEGIPSK